MKEQIIFEATYKKHACKFRDGALPILPGCKGIFDVKEAYLLKDGKVERTTKNIDPSKSRTEQLEFQDIRVYLKPIERGE